MSLFPRLVFDAPQAYTKRTVPAAPTIPLNNILLPGKILDIPD
jgi:hypothetical protein